jgi:hypothetical protein
LVQVAEMEPHNKGAALEEIDNYRSISQSTT